MSLRKLHFIDGTATATNISNYFYTLWPKRSIELFTKVVEIRKVHHADFVKH